MKFYVNLQKRITKKKLYFDTYFINKHDFAYEYSDIINTLTVLDIGEVDDRG